MSSGVFARSKGQRAERAVIKLLQPIVDMVFEGIGREAPDLERNLIQSHKGGYDIVGLDWLALEVKHQETLHLNDWWNQTVDQSRRNITLNREAVLIYKQNRTKWRVMMWGHLPLGERKVRCRVDIDLESFLLWFEHRLKMEVSK